MPQSQLVHFLNVQPRIRSLEDPEVIKLCNFDLKSPTLTERVSVLFAFPGHLSADGLRFSLSRLLEKYPVCCGRLEQSTDGYQLVCNSAGVPVWEFSQDEDIDVSDSSLARKASHFTQDIDPKRLLKGADALLKVQVTHCGRAQTLLGFTLAHVMSDIGGLVFLLREWMSLHNGPKPFQKPVVLPKPIFDRSHVHPDETYMPDSGSEGIFMAPHKKTSGLMSMCLALFCMLLQLFWQGGFSTFAPTTLIIPSTSLRRLKDRTNRLTLAGPNQLSGNDLLCSLLWHVTCIVRQRPDVSTGTFFFPMDLRQMHVPDDYFGNAQCIQAVCDPKKTVIAPADLSPVTVAENIALTARIIRKTVLDARVPAISAQQASMQLGPHSQPLVRRMQRKLSLMTTYDASLSSWQDLYRCVSWLDFGTGLATGITALQRDEDLQPWAGWWGQNPLSGQAVLYVNVPPGKRSDFISCPLWSMLLPGAHFV